MGTLETDAKSFHLIVVVSQRWKEAISFMENIHEELSLGKNSHPQDLESAIQMKQ